jgi:hypothetical protein
MVDYEEYIDSLNPSERIAFLNGMRMMTQLTMATMNELEAGINERSIEYPETLDELIAETLRHGSLNLVKQLRDTMTGVLSDLEETHRSLEGE